MNRHAAPQHSPVSFKTVVQTPKKVTIDDFVGENGLVPLTQAHSHLKGSMMSPRPMNLRPRQRRASPTHTVFGGSDDEGQGSEDSKEDNHQDDDAEITDPPSGQEDETGQGHHVADTTYVAVTGIR
ncbi:hypothetical protein EMPS_07761 [Entomortierella parvispora]|uniref:Uncharacterized protein n=1 Tax=Entomortierella parvispora TaxID=205924 RepID=A0A9P3HF47_9FUNG|nr:hypothetical protein EMPS_07761 [Entomortierella parvispora]